MKSVAIVYATRYGQTAKIARYMKETLERRGLTVELIEVSGDRNTPEPSQERDAILVGGPIYRQSFPEPLSRWVRHHRRYLATRQSALFSVSLNAADPRPQARQADRVLLEAFMRETGWTPSQATALAGAFNYRRYGFLVRWLMRPISRSTGGPTDTSRDYEMTDWEEVDGFLETALRLGRGKLAAGADDL